MFAGYKQDLIVYGLVIYLASLLLGAFLGVFRNPRMALSTHVTGLMIGIFSLALAAVSDMIHLGARASALAYNLHIIGNTLLTISLGFAAHWNTRSKTPIAGGKVPASPGHEMIVRWGIVGASVMLVVSCGLLIAGAVVY